MKKESNNSIYGSLEDNNKRGPEDVNNNRKEELPADNGKLQNINGISKLFSVVELSDKVMLSSAAALGGDRVSDLGVTCLISAAPELPPLPLSTSVKRHHTVDVRDSPAADIGRHLHRVADIIHQVVNEGGGKVLVYCVAGISRSVSLCLGYLIKYKGMSLKQAYIHVHRMRPCVRPNTGFFSQLIDFEVEISGSKTVAMVHNQAAGGLIPDVYVPDYLNTMRWYNSRCFGTK